VEHAPSTGERVPDGWSTIDGSMLQPLFITAIGMTLLMVTLHMAAMRNEILRRRVRTLELLQAGGREA